LTSVPWQRAGVASGTNNTVRQVGSAFGVAVIGAVLVAQISSVGRADLAANPIIPDTVKAYLQTVLDSGLTGGITPSLPSNLTIPVLEAIRTVFDDAITQGTRLAALVAAIFVSLGAASSLLIPNTKPQIVITKVVGTERKSPGEEASPQSEK